MTATTGQKQDALAGASSPSRIGRGQRNRDRARRLSSPKPRLTTPLIRRNGQLEKASWDEALGLVADRFSAIKDDHGPEAFAMFSCSKSTNEMNYAAQKFSRAMLGSNNIDSCNRT